MRNLIATALGAAFLAGSAHAANDTIRVSGSGTLDPGRTFTLSAQIYADGTVKGHATLINRNFSGDSGKGPYIAQIDISCAKLVDDNTIIIGGFTHMTNDSNLDDAVFFEVRDNGKEGDLLSRAYFWDGDPETTGDPATCTLADGFPMEELDSGNIKIN